MNNLMHIRNFNVTKIVGEYEILPESRTGKHQIINSK